MSGGARSTLLTLVQTLLAPLIFRLDILLRRRRGVFEYSSHPDCIFRAERTSLECMVRLSDGTCLKTGDSIVRIHVWNEHVPVPTAGKPTLHWARRMNRSLDVSLRELARFIQTSPGFRNVRAVRAEMTFGTDEETKQLLRICGRYGFRPVEETERSSSSSEQLHRLGENVLVALFVLARNPWALRWDCLRRARVDVMLPRSSLDARYREAGATEE